MNDINQVIDYVKWINSLKLADVQLFDENGDLIVIDPFVIEQYWWTLKQNLSFFQYRHFEYSPHIRSDGGLVDKYDE